LKNLNFGRREFYFVLFLQAITLFFVASTLGISPSEGRVLYGDGGFVALVYGGFYDIVGRSEYTLRLLSIYIHLLNGILFFELSYRFFKKESFAFFASLLFLLLPGVNSAAILLSKAGIVIFFTLFFLYIFFRYKKVSYILLFSCTFLDSAFAILLFALILYGVSKRDGKLIAVSTLLFSLSMYLYGFDTSGKPKGHFMDTLGIYVAIFSPLLFIYFFYSIYRTSIKEEKNIIWYITATALFLSLLLSFRQRIEIDSFAPFLVLGAILLTKTFFDGYMVRLPQFRKRYRAVSFVVLGVLVLNSAILYGNKFLYNIIENPEKHFAHNFHYSKELAELLHSQNVDFVTSSNKALLNQLRFYGIKGGELYRVEDYKFSESAQKVSILYNQREISTFYVSKVNI